MLSISGLRGLIGQSLTPVVAARYGAAIGQWLKTKRPGAPTVVVGRDSRPSGEMIEAAVVSGLVATGCKVVKLGIVTTPSVGVMAEEVKADGGIVITASHNPIVWNGIKVLRSDGVAPPPEEAKIIIETFKSDSAAYAPVEGLSPITTNDKTNAIHVARVLANVDVALIKKKKFKVVLDSVHGAGGAAGAMLLNALGVELVHLFAEPTGLFPHVPEPTRENLAGLSDVVRQHKADVGFAQDPDADRLAIIDETGGYIGEECSLALAAIEVMSGGTGLKPGGVVVANLSTSRMVDDIAAKYGGRVVRTAVGEANVAQAMRLEGAGIGGEGNGGVIWPKVIHVRDSLAGMALVLQYLARSEKPLSKHVEEISKYWIIKDKIDLKPGMAEKIRPVLMETYKAQKLDTQDGVRIDWPDAWVHARTSNTEPIMRIIAEAPTESRARAMVADVRKALGL
jgi:phosphomannomutase